MRATLVLVTIALVLTNTVKVSARRFGEWYIDETNRTGILARVSSGVSIAGEFMVAFEFSQNCQPVFSSVEMTQMALGTVLGVNVFPPQTVFLSVDGEHYTWDGVRVHYSGGTETGIGLTREAWNALISRPRRISFTDLGGAIYEVPMGSTGNGHVSDIIQYALETCINRL